MKCFWEYVKIEFAREQGRHHQNRKTHREQGRHNQETRREREDTISRRAMQSSYDRRDTESHRGLPGFPALYEHPIGEKL
jgi:hypothetical protein